MDGLMDYCKADGLSMLNNYRRIKIFTFWIRGDGEHDRMLGS